MIIHNQAVQTTQNQSIANTGKLANKSDISNIQVTVFTNGDQSSYNYVISKNKNELFGNALKNENDATQIIVNGAMIPLSQLKETPVSAIKGIQVFMSNGAKINGSYSINGKTYSLPSNPLSQLTTNSAQIYVPNYILLSGQKCSVTINGKNYVGTQNGDYVQVSGPININSDGNNNVNININSNKSETVPQNESTQVIVINQNGMELSSTTLNHPSGLQLALQIASIKGNITSMTFNGNYLDLSQLMDEQYQPNSQNMLVITEYSEPTINVHMTFSHVAEGQTYTYDMYVPDLNDAINTYSSIQSTGAIINLPPVLVKKFDINYVMINGIRYNGYLKGNQYIVDRYIPTEPNYNVNLHTTRKVWY